MSEDTFECPVCKATLNHRRVDDGSTHHSISKKGKIEITGERSDGYDEVTCSKNSDHEIPTDLQEAVLSLVWAFENKEIEA